jgi:hypothetical protein
MYPLETNWLVGGSSPLHGKDVCFQLFVLSCIGIGLATDWSPVQRVLPTLYKMDNFRINSEWEQVRELSPIKWNKKNNL